jgi:hypothetical protein
MQPRRFEIGASGMWYAAFLREAGISCVYRSGGVYLVQVGKGKPRKMRQKQLSELIDRERVKAGLEPIKRRDP